MTTKTKSAAKKPTRRRAPAKKTATKSKPATLVIPTATEVTQAGGVPQVAEADLPIPTGWRLLVKMAEPKRKTAGGVYMPDVSVEAEEYLVYIGKVLRMGPLCYSPERPAFEGGAPWCKVGDWIAFGQHAGQAIEIFGERFKILNDDSVMAVIPEPDIIKIYV